MAGGWSRGRAPPVVEGPSGRVVAGVFGGGAAVLSVHFVGFKRPFLAAFLSIFEGRPLSVFSGKH